MSQNPARELERSRRLVSGAAQRLVSPRMYSKNQKRPCASAALCLIGSNIPNGRARALLYPRHHHFPNYLKLLRLGNGRLRLVIDVRAVLKKDSQFKRFLGGLTNDTNLSLVKGESA